MLAEIAAAIKVRLKRLEDDKQINKINTRGLPLLFHAGAYESGSRVFVRYIDFQGWSSLTKAEALQYLEWLDAGNVGTHYQMQTQRKGGGQ